MDKLAQPYLEGVESESFTNAAVRRITRPCVYLFLKEGRALYVGTSVNGFCRFGSPDHNRAQVRNHADEIRVLWFDNASWALEIEKRLIRDLEPPFNTRGNRNNSIAKANRLLVRLAGKAGARG